jgi:hypothetical protein
VLVERDPELARCVGRGLGRGEHEPVPVRHGVASVGQHPILKRVSHGERREAGATLVAISTQTPDQSLANPV